MKLQGTIVSTIPDEIIFSHILPRLPLKPLLRFKNVRKSWFSVISDPYFANQHLALLKERQDGGNLLIICNQLSSLVFGYLHLASLNGREPTTHLLTRPLDSHIHSSASINGMVCLYLLYSSICYICNPKIQEIIELPSVFDNAPIDITYYGDISYSLGYEPLRQEYKVFRIAGVNVSTMNIVVCEIFTLGANSSWRRIDFDAIMPFKISYEDVVSIFNRKGLCVNGALHWLFSSKNVVLVFDLKDEKFQALPVSDGVVIHRYPRTYPSCFQRLIRINGCLRFVDIKYVVPSDIMELWILKDYQNLVWTKETVIIPHYFDGWPCPAPFPLGTLPTGEILFQFRLTKIFGGFSLTILVKVFG